MGHAAPRFVIASIHIFYEPIDQQTWFLLDFFSQGLINKQSFIYLFFQGTMDQPRCVLKKYKKKTKYHSGFLNVFFSRTNKGDVFKDSLTGCEFLRPFIKKRNGYLNEYIFIYIHIYLFSGIILGLMNSL